MADERVRVVIDKKGNAKVEMFGFHDAGCAAVADRLRSIGPVRSETNKPEFYEKTSSGQTLDMRLR
jgi:hypothetical protein